MSRLPIYTNLSVGLCLNLVGPTCVSYTALFDRGKYKAREYVFICQVKKKILSPRMKPFPSTQVLESIVVDYILSTVPPVGTFTATRRADCRELQVCC